MRALAFGVVLCGCQVPAPVGDYPRLQSRGVELPLCLFWCRVTAETANAEGGGGITTTITEAEARQ